MKIFNPTRLELAREICLMTKRDLAAQLNVSYQMITEYESGAVEPPSDRVERMSAVLQFPTKFFYGTDVERSQLKDVTFRSKRSMTQKIRHRVTGVGAVAAGLISPNIRSYFNLPTPNIPKLGGWSPTEAAAFVRSEWKLGYGPIDDLMREMETNGIEVYTTHEQCPSVDAVSFWLEDRPYVMYSGRISSGERVRLNLAHELGHLVLHHEFHEDLESATLEIESEAFEFASAFLMPRINFSADIRTNPITLNNFFLHKKKWKVSAQAMIRWARDTGLITTWQYVSMMQEIGANNYRLCEPYEFPVEESFTQEFVFNRLSQKGITPEEFADKCGVDVNIVCELIPAARKYRKIDYASLLTPTDLQYLEEY